MQTPRSDLVRSALGALGLALALASCTSAPTRPIPDPLPETLEWARPEGAEGAFLGLEVRENDSGSLEDLFFAPGAKVVGVADGSPALAAGIRVGDVLRAFDGVEVNDPGTLEALLRDAPADHVASLEVQRGDSTFALEVPLRGGAGAAEAEAEDGVARLLYASDTARSLASWRAGRGGVVLVASHERAPFPRAGVPVGSVVTALDGEPVRSERALVRELVAREPGTAVRVTWHDGGEGAEERETSVRLYTPPHKITEATLPILAGYYSDLDGDSTTVYLLDLWVIWLFKYERDGEEQRYSFLRFITFASGVGELSEGQ